MKQTKNQKKGCRLLKTDGGKDDAVAAVVALMLVLAVIVTCLAVYTTSYIPSLKQQAEISHTDEVLYTFKGFSAEMDSIYATGELREYSNPLVLGAGDILLSPSKSSGTIEITGNPIGSLKVGTGSGYTINSIDVSYTPSFTVWEPQGVHYENGVLWITKEDKKTPASLTDYTIESGLNQEEKIVKNRLGKIEKTMPETMDENMELTIITAEKKTNQSEITGSGIADLHVETKMENTDILLNNGDKLILTSGDGKTLKETTVSTESVNPLTLTLHRIIIEVSVQ